MSSADVSELCFAGFIIISFLSCIFTLLALYEPSTMDSSGRCGGGLIVDNETFDVNQTLDMFSKNVTGNFTLNYQ